MIAGTKNGDVVLSVRGVSATRGDTPILDEVRFDVVDRIREGRTTGQVVSILGPSGVGKTTLLRILAALDRPASGSVVGPGDAPLEGGSVGLVFQDYPLFRHRRVLDNLVVAGRIGGMRTERARARARELLERVGLEAYADRFPAQLSGGQRQRVAIAQQLVLPRRLLLLDEPFSGLDPRSLGEVATLVTEVANEHQLNTVLVVTHDLRAALSVSDTIHLLAKPAGQSGASVQATWDLVDRGVAWELAKANARAAAELEGEIASRFLEVA